VLPVMTCWAHTDWEICITLHQDIPVHIIVGIQFFVGWDSVVGVTTV